MKRTGFETNWADFERNPNGPARYRFARGGNVLKRNLTDGVHWSDLIRIAEPVCYRWIKIQRCIVVVYRGTDQGLTGVQQGYGSTA
jgi:hypothetical protein